MDEKFLLEWSETLAGLRAKRLEEFTRWLQQKGTFTPNYFFEIAAASLDEILDQWFQVEQRSAQESIVNLDQIRSELDGVFDFELDAISNDMSTIRMGARWGQADVDAGLIEFESASQEIKNKYSLKINTLGSAVPSLQKKKVVEGTIDRPTRTAGVSSGGGGATVILMFLLGLLLGAAPSVYFWKESRSQLANQQEERNRIVAEQRALEDSMTMLQQRFDELANGKISNLPEIDREISRIRSSIREKKAAAEASFNQDREKLLKRVPAGGRQDVAIGEAEQAFKQRIADLEAQEARALESLEKNRKALQELLIR